MKLARVSAVLLYLSTQVLFAPSGFAVLAPIPIQSGPLSTGNNLAIPAVPNLFSLNINDHNVNMLYIAGKFSGASLEVDEVNFKVTLNENGNGLLIQYGSEEESWIVGGGVVHSKGDVDSLTLTFNSGFTFLVSYNRSKNEMVISRRTEGVVENGYDGGLLGTKKEEVTSTSVYNKEGIREHEFIDKNYYGSDSMGNVKLGLSQIYMKYQYSGVGELVRVDGEGREILYDDTDFSIIEGNVNQRSRVVNGNVEMEERREERRHNPKEKSSSKEDVPVVLADHTSSRLGEWMERRMRSAQRYGWSGSTNGDREISGLGMARLPMNLVKRKILGITDWREPLERLIQYIYNSSGTVERFEFQMVE